MARGKRRAENGGRPAMPLSAAVPSSSSSSSSTTTELPTLLAEPQVVQRRWEPSRSQLGGRRARQSFTYEAYVPRAIAELEPRLDSGVVMAISEAEQACRALNEDPPSALSLEALARQLLRAEAVASSRIEHLVVSHRHLARAFFEPVRHDTAAEVVANVRAAQRAIELATEGPITLETLTEVHRVLLTGTRGEHYGGLIREEQNWIGGTQPNPHGADFVPPPSEYVKPALDDLVVFANRDDLPPALQASIAHAQFETIHPFWDGNGRVGRALIHAILRRRGLAPRYVPPVSLVLAGRADDYIRGLTAYRYGDGEDWYAIFADALRASAAGAREFAGRVATLQDRWLKQAGNPRRGAGARKLIDALPAHPVVDVRTAQDVLGARSQETARAAIIRLVSAGVLREVKMGRKRGRLWESVGLFDLLDSFERELGPIGRAPSASKP